jgi:hypothetical protein
MADPRIPTTLSDEKLQDEKLSVSSQTNQLESGAVTSWEGVSFTPRDVGFLLLDPVAPELIDVSSRRWPLARSISS